MTITISGSIAQGPSWERLEQLVNSMMPSGRDVDERPGKFVRISRRDHGPNYRASSGIYDLTYVPTIGDAVEIELRVNCAD